MNILKQRNGYITLISVMVVSAVGLSIAVSLILLGIGAGKNSQSQEYMVQARGLSNACAELALLQVRNSNAYIGTTNVTLGAGECSYTVSSSGGANREIQSTGTVKGVVRKVKVLINQLTPTLNVSSWQEVVDF